MSIQSWLPLYQNLIESAIRDFFEKRYANTTDIEKKYEEAIRYAVESGGKRIRPILAMIAYEHHTGQDIAYWWTPDGARLLGSMIGIEFMHCYTLVHDDLPSMDNDELRRGKPTVWKVYWESMALLVWDTLQTMSFELLSFSGDSRVVTELARALWDLWVARWQVRDTFLRHDTLSLDQLLRIHDEKTGIFIVASLMIGTLLAWWDSASENQMRKLWILLGRAFQIQDDILDADGDAATVWKKTQKDILLGKWIVSLLWLAGSRNLLNQIAQDIQGIIDIIDHPRLADMAHYVIERQN